MMSFHEYANIPDFCEISFKADEELKKELSRLHNREVRRISQKHDEILETETYETGDSAKGRIKS